MTSETSKESPRRSLYKTLTWRVVATSTTMSIVWLFTGKPLLATGVGIVEVLAKMILYYLHERVWSSTAVGSQPESPPRTTTAGECPVCCAPVAFDS